MTLSNLVVSILRTVVPAGVGLVLARLGIAAVDIDGMPLETLLSLVVIGVYYAVMRLAGKRWPIVGIMLGWKAAPIYGHSVPADGLTRQLFLERGGDGERPGRYED